MKAGISDGKEFITDMELDRLPGGVKPFFDNTTVTTGRSSFLCGRVGWVALYRARQVFKPFEFKAPPGCTIGPTVKT